MADPTHVQMTPMKDAENDHHPLKSTGDSDSRKPTNVENKQQGKNNQKIKNVLFGFFFVAFLCLIVYNVIPKDRCAKTSEDRCAKTSEDMCESPNAEGFNFGVEKIIALSNGSLCL